MGDEIVIFTVYLQNEKKASENTVKSYQRDLRHFANYLEGIGIYDVSKVTRTCLNSYLLFLEKEGKAASSISRMLASIRSFFRYELNYGRIRKDPSELIRGPKVRKNEPTVLTEEEVARLLGQPDGNSPKEIRDRAMLELLYATGIRVSELVGLRTEDLNRSLGCIRCRDSVRDRMIPYGKEVEQRLQRYLSTARPELLKGKESEALFVNCNGSPMSRQGFWKIVKHYGDKAKIRGDITPYSLKHSYEAHIRDRRQRQKQPETA